MGPGLRDLLLVCLTFGSGAVDAISFLGLGRVFTANMTGNIVLLGLAAGRASGSEVVRSAVSLVAFAVGAFVASRVIAPGAKRDSWSREMTVALSVGVLAQMVFVAGWQAASGRPGEAGEAVLVGVSALAMGVQSGAVRALGVPGVTTTYVTGTLTGLVGGLASAVGAPAERVRRVGVLVALLAGAAGGGLLVVGVRTLAPVLPLLVTAGVVVTAICDAHARHKAAAVMANEL